MKLSNKETARQAIELLDLRHEPAVELYTKKSMAYMLNHPPFDINSYKNIHAPNFFQLFRIWFIILKIFLKMVIRLF